MRWFSWHLPGLDTLAIAGGVAFLLFGFLWFGFIRAGREKKAKRRLKAALADQTHLPDSLHPVIDPDVCIGSLSCITACPEGDILGVVDGVAKLIIGSNCIGHGRCVTECPVGAIKLVIGTSERGVDLPQVDTNFESSRPGVHVVGELGGMGLIRNALRQGLQAAEHLGRELGSRSGRSECDVVIVGAGPAGLATAVGLRAAGVSFRLLEQGRFGGTIAHYPRHKVVMTERVQMPIVGTFGRPVIGKEELLDSFVRIARKAEITIEEGTKVEGIVGNDGRFELHTSRGPVRARKVVLATGRRGTPRKLGVPGENLDKLTYALVDAEQYAGSRVLVVGGGDSALEAAIALAERKDVDVMLSYRKAAFGKCREANRKRVGELIDSGAIHALMSSTVEAIDAESVTISYQGKSHRLTNDWVIACLGGEMPVEFLKNVGVDLVRHKGENTAHMPALGRAKGSSNHLAIGLALVGVALIAGLAWIGQDYYLLDRRARSHSQLHDFLRSSGPWGHGVGIVATAFMMLNFLYPLRKRLGFLKGTAPIRSWLTFHIFVGVMSPLVIAFHAAFQSRNQLATATFVSLCVVVGTGLIGRFVYGLVPSVGGTATELGMVRAQLQREEKRLRPEDEATASDERLQKLLAQLRPDVGAGRSLFGHLFVLPLRYLRMRWQIRGVRKKFEGHEAYDSFKTHYLVARRLRLQVTFYSSLRRLLSGWRVFHVVLSVLLVLIIALHVGLSIYLGYRWIF